jgi:hypothetical protein
MKLMSIIMAVMMTSFYHPVKNDTDKQSKGTGDKNGFVVVELFTSEGCSSCPPADKLVERIQKNNPNQPIYILAFHVDYWNNLGWKDRFSDAAFTARQRQYAEWLHLETVYTPQIVVNGKSEYVGSDEHSILNAVNRELDQPSVNTLTLKGRVDADKAIIDYTTTSGKNSELVLALVQKSAQSNVRAGENTGKQLYHVQIVRQLFRRDVKNKKTITMKLPGDFNAKDWELIGFTQNKDGGQMTSAGVLQFVR